MPKKYYTLEELPGASEVIEEIADDLQATYGSDISNFLFSGMIHFSICRHKQYCTLHLMLFKDIYVLNGLPEPQNLRYGIYNIWWHTGPAFAEFVYKDTDSREELEQLAHKRLAKNLSATQYATAFSSPDWWTGFEKALLLSHFTDCKKKKRKKRLAKFDESLQKFKQAHNWPELRRDSFFAPDNFDLTALDSIFPIRPIEQQIPKGTILYLDHKGCVVKGHSTFYPLKLCRLRFVQGINILLSRQTITNLPVYQYLKKYERKLQVGVCQKHLPDYLTPPPPPLHLGWCNTSELYYYSGIDPLSPYGNYYIRDGELENVNKQPIEKIPPNIHFPLLAYAVFSIIKYFIPEYPSRISVNEPYRKVLREKSKLFYMSLFGDAREQFADIFFGGFTDYGLPTSDQNADGEKPADKMLSLYQSRVHDGIVILTKEYNSLVSFQENDLIQDACVVCTNALFEKNDSEIKILVSKSLSTERIEQVKHDIHATLLQFILKFEKFANQQMAQMCAQCSQNIIRITNNYYESIASKYIASDLEDYESIWTTDSEDEPPRSAVRFSTLRYLRRTILENTKYWLLSGLSQEEYKQEQSLFEATAKEIGCEINQCYSDFLNSLVDLKRAEEMLQLPSSRSNQKYIYLCAALNTFADVMLKENEREAFSQKSCEAIYQLYQTNLLAKSMLVLFGEFLTDRILSGKIILIRSKRKKGTIGWYDPQRDVIYLSVKKYYNDFSAFYRKKYAANYPSNKEHLQSELEALGIIPPKSRAPSKGGYRPGSRIVVAPVGKGPQKKEHVLKISLPQFEFAPAVRKKLTDLGVPERRRSRSKKSAKKKASS